MSPRSLSEYFCQNGRIAGLIFGNECGVRIQAVFVAIKIRLERIFTSRGISAGLEPVRKCCQPHGFSEMISVI